MNCSICNKPLEKQEVIEGTCATCAGDITAVAYDIDTHWHDDTEGLSVIPCYLTKRVVNGRVLPCKGQD